MSKGWSKSWLLRTKRLLHWNRAAFRTFHPSESLI
ncbi:hypothetical protein BVRB_5g112440 [Beta vulgaris subsp. vulgaris]|nr:hypothetical protein BVRB_5g112440 [Beta vulgaris subsp. vulgaris]